MSYPRSDGRPGIDTAVGLALATGLAAWAVLAHSDAPDSVEFAMGVFVAVLAWTLGDLLARRNITVLALTMSALVGAATITGVPAWLDGSGATAPPLGYANANGALLTAGVALTMVAHSTQRRHRPVLLAAALLLTAMAVVTGSLAATFSCVALLVGTDLVWRRGRRLTWQVASGGLLVAGLASTVGLVRLHEAGRVPDPVRRSLSDQRLNLWSDALDLFEEDHTVGIGAGNFPSRSATALGDPDLAHAHSFPLETAAEQGLVGAVLMACVVVWMIIRLGRASTVMAVLALQPFVDYVLSFDMVVMAFGVALGAASTRTADPHETPRRPRGLH